MELSKSQVDSLGLRLRRESFTQEDLRLLDTYRLSFVNAHEEVISQIVSKLRLAPTGRPSKSTTSIIDKLRRESIRLSQMQDIAGCRIVVKDIADQEEAVQKLAGLFNQHALVDRRSNPSHGYRAVHLVVKISGKLIEVQVRTLLQHLWAEVSEKLADMVDITIKYGGGPTEIATPLAKLSEQINGVERNEELFQGLLREDQDLRLLMQSGSLSDELKQEAILLIRKTEDLRMRIDRNSQTMTDIMKSLVEEIEELP